MEDIITQFFTNYTFRTVTIASMIICFIIGSIGTFAVLRKQSLLGDTISHATFPGIALIFLVTLSKDPIIILSGALFSGLLSAVLVFVLTEYTKLKSDAVLGIILSVSFGIGLVLLSIIQNLGISHQSGLNNFLFGNAATLVETHIFLFTGIGIILFLFLILYWKELKLTVFNLEFAKVLGLRVKALNFLLNILLVSAIVLGLQAVGVVLISALVVSPASASRQWSNSLVKVFLLAGLFGAISGLIGSIISSSYSQMPTGPVIVVCLTIIFVFSILLAPNRGLLTNRKINLE